MKALKKIDAEDHMEDDVSEIVEFPLSEEGGRVSEAEYWERYYEHPDFQYEWNDGRLEAKPVSDFATWLTYHWLTELLGIYLRNRPVAAMVGLDFGFRMALPFKTVVRKPDLGVVLNDNPMALGMKDRSYKGVYDLCVEAMSYLTKKDVERDTVQKKAEYEAGGVREYWILDDKGRETAFYALDQSGVYQRIVPAKGGVIQSAVLPDFQFRISDLTRKPSPEEMSNDEVYQSFVLPDYQAQKQRAEKEYLRAEDERRKAETVLQRSGELEEKLALERKRADHLAEKLRQLGISPD